MPDEIQFFESDDMRRIVEATRFVESFRLQPPRPEIVQKGGALKRKVRILSEGKTAGHYLGRCLGYDADDNTHADLTGDKVWIADINDADLKLGVRYDAELAGYFTSAGGEQHAVYQTNAAAQSGAGSVLRALTHVCLLHNITSYAGGDQTTINSNTLTDLTGTEVTVKVYAPAPVVVVGVFDIRGNTAAVTFDCGSGDGSVDTFKGYLVKDGTPETRVAVFSPAHPLARATVMQVWPLSLEIGTYVFKLQGARAGASGGTAVYDTETSWAMYGDALCVDARTITVPGATLGATERLEPETDCCKTLEVDVEGAGELSSDNDTTASIGVDVTGAGQLSSDAAVGVEIVPTVEGIGELSSDRALYAVVSFDVQGVGELSSDAALYVQIANYITEVEGKGELSSDQGMLVALAAYTMDVEGKGELSSDKATSAIISVDVEGAGDLSSDQGMLAALHNTVVDVEGKGELSSDAAVDTEIFDGFWHVDDFDPTVHDYSRQHNDGTSVDDFVWWDETNATNPQGYTYSLNLTTDGGRVEIPYISQYSVGANSFTINVWFMQNSLTVDASGKQWLIGQNDGTDWWALLWDPSAGASGQLQFQFHTGGVTQTVVAYNWPGAVNQWQNATIRRETTGTAQAWSLWLNGASVATSSTAWTVPTIMTALVFGRPATGWVDVVFGPIAFWRAAVKDARLVELARRTGQVTVEGKGELSSDAATVYTAAPIVPGTNCATAAAVSPGTTYGAPFTIANGAEHWFVFTAPIGTAKLVMDTSANLGENVYAPSAGGDPCASLSSIFGGATGVGHFCHDNPDWYALMSGSSAGPHYLKVSNGTGSSATYTFSIESGSC